jgi:translation initiation factor IF-2
MAFYDAGGMGEQPMGGGGGAARKPRKGGSAAAVPGQMTNTAMPGTQQLAVAPPDPGAGTFPDASGNTAPPVDNPMGSGKPMGGFQQLAQQPSGGLEGYTPGPMQFGGAPGAAPGKPGKGGGAAAIPGGGIMPPGPMGGARSKPDLGIGSMIRNRVGALRNRERMGGGMGGGY